MKNQWFKSRYFVSAAFIALLFLLLLTGSIPATAQQDKTITSEPLSATSSLTIYGDLADGEVLNLHCNSDWETCRNASSSNAIWSNLLDLGTVGVNFDDLGYNIERTFFFFDTSSIPANANIVSATMNVYFGQWQSGETTVHLVRSTAHIPLTTADFSRIEFASGGSASPPSPFMWMGIDLNSSALSWIVKGGMTRLALIHRLDLYNIAPTTANTVLISLAENAEYRPYLEVTYSTTNLVAQIDNFLTLQGSPLAGYGSVFVDYGRTYNVDPRLIVAIAGAESGFGKTKCQTWNAADIFNAWGYMYWPNGVRTCRPFTSWNEGIRVVSWQIGASSLYLKAGRTTIQSIGELYCGASCTNWFNNVALFFGQMGGDPNNLFFPGVAPDEMIIQSTRSGTGWAKISDQTNVNCAYNVDNLYYAQTKRQGDVDKSTWWLNVPSDGLYQIYVYMPDYQNSLGISTHARYWVDDSNIPPGAVANLVILDQNLNKCGWAYLGQYWLLASEVNQNWVYLGNGNIPNEVPVPKWISADAVKLVKVDSDTTAPDGNLISPVNGASYTQGQTIQISANASDNVGGSGVNRVEIYAQYDGNWHLINEDTSLPYEYSWTIPTNLNSQSIIITIHVVDNAGNRKMDPGGYRTVTYRNSPNENAISASRRFYLNQLALVDGWQKCGVASAAMVLASNSYINGSFNSMKAEAEQMWNEGVRYPDTEMVARAFRRRGFSATTYNSTDYDTKWNILKQEINADRPVMMGTGRSMTSGGHYIVAVGYRDSSDPNQRMIYVYDPYGQHSDCYPASNCPNFKDRWIRVNSSDPNSTVGKWVVYPWNKLTPKIIVVQPSGLLTPANSIPTIDFETEIVTDEPSGPLDESLEPAGGNTPTLWLPFVKR